jgi:beta-lactamase regulating signal transducer with metallopeptidase domain
MTMPQFVDLFRAAGEAHAGMTILVDSAVKGGVILVLAAAVAIGCRRASAAARHLGWALAVVGLCALPALSLIAPAWTMPILPPSIDGALPPPLPRPAASVDRFRAEVDPESILRPRDGLAAAAVTRDAKALDESNRAAARVVAGRWMGRILFIWFAGASIVTLRILASLLAAWHKGRRAAPINDGAWASLAREIAARYGLRRRLSLRVTSQGAIPATMGHLRPVVLLPVEAIDWPPARLGAVFAHELAHIARGDFLVQTLARFACALHWFNPLAWFAERRLRTECEQASDDLVLALGLDPADYATHLVEILGSAGQGRSAPLGALAMGCPGGLEGRLRAILDGARPRRGLAPRRVALAALVATPFLLLSGLVRLEARAHDAPKIEHLPRGMTAEIVAVSTHPSGPMTWWGPDGTPLAQAPCDPPDEAVAAPDQVVREVVARINGLPQDATVVWHPTQCSSRGTAPPRKGGVPVPGLQRVVAEFPQGLATCVVHFDVALGPWATEQASAKSIGIEKDDRAFFFGKPRDIPPGTAIAIAHNINDRDVRVVAVDRDGREHLPRSTMSGGARHLKMLDVEFDLPPGQIREYRLQSRPVGRFEIKDVALQPRKVGS